MIFASNRIWVVAENFSTSDHILRLNVFEKLLLRK